MKREYFNELAPRWDSLPAPPDTPARVSRFLRAAVRGGERRILDVGSGTGILLDSLPPGVVACDFAEAMLRRAREKHGAGHRYVCADAAHTPFAGEAFDLALCFNVLPHFADVRTALRELLGCVRRGGRLAVGHMMGSAQLNAMHAHIGGVVGADALPPAADLAGMFRCARVVMAEESPEHYLVVAER